MKKGFNRLVVFFLTVSMLFTSICFSFAEASSVSGDLNNATENELRSEESKVDESVNQNSENKEEIKQETSSNLDSKENADVSNVNNQVSDEMRVIYVESPKLEAPATQNIAIIWKNDLSSVRDAKLVVINPNGQEISIPEAKRTDKAILFSRDFSTNEVGNYKVKKITYFVEGSEEQQVLDFVDVDINESFDVVNEAGDSQSTSGVATIDVSGNSVSEKQVESQINSAIQEIDKVRTLSSKKGPIVVVLDPGHGGVDPGACANGLKEKDLTLKIAKYCKQELEKYSGIQVYMTRTADTTAPGYHENKALNKIVEYAYNKKADILVSIHINSGGGTGAEVWYPNDSSYKNELHDSGGKLSKSILSEIQKLGLKSRGIKTKDDYGPVTYYPDGSVADYYGIIRKSRKAGFLGIIVEHAFIDNANDANFLKSEANLKKLGVADAVGIAKYFGVNKGTWETTADGKKYKKPDGTYAKGWEQIQSKWYYFDSQGYMKTGWVHIANNWYYFSNSGIMLTGWQLIDGKWYYMNSSGERQTGWIKLSGKSYYLYEDGHMAANERTPDGYYVNSSGVWIADKWKKNSRGWWYQYADGGYAVGWAKIAGNYYYFNKNGYMLTGWQYIDKKWYYMNSSGVRKTGWIKVGGKQYYLYEDGHMAANEITPDGHYVSSSGALIKDEWKKNSRGWWYQYKDGSYAVGWAKIAGNYYYFNKNGYMLTGWQYISGKWYYMNSSGVRKTGWIKLSGKQYYLYQDGHMAQSQRTPDGYYVNGSGVWIADRWRKNSVGWWYQYGEGTYAVGYKKIGRDHYYFNSRGYMQIYHQMINGHPYEFYSSGQAYGKGWIKCANGKRAYCLGGGKLAVGSMTIGGIDYKFDSNGYLIEGTKHRIDGSSNVTASKLKALYLKSSPISYPSYYKNTDAPTLDAFCNLYVEEAKKENIKPEVAFCQAMLETGWLTFKGSVKIGQFNFAGLGAVSSSASGASFKSVRIGIRAQIQHLKAYANKAPLNYAQVDPRFKYVKRGTAPFVEWLGQKENPNGYGWATAQGYGDRILRIMKQL